MTRAIKMCLELYRFKLDIYKFHARNCAVSDKKFSSYVAFRLKDSRLKGSLFLCTVHSHVANMMGERRKRGINKQAENKHGSSTVMRNDRVIA